MSEQAKRIAEALAAPFEVSEVKWKPQRVSGNRACMIAYVDARVIQDRLDEVLGVMGWQDSYECLPDGSVTCRLRIRLDGEWIEKMDVGGQSEQPDEGDRRKAAFSDALKRASVKFGVGRYLYRLGSQWADYDPVKKRVIGTPRLPADAQPEAPPAAPAPPPRQQRQLPATGDELRNRLIAQDVQLWQAGLCSQDALLNHVVANAGRTGHMVDWQPGFEDVMKLAVRFARSCYLTALHPLITSDEIRGRVLTRCGGKLGDSLESLTISQLRESLDWLRQQAQLMQKA